MHEANIDGTLMEKKKRLFNKRCWNNWMSIWGKIQPSTFTGIFKELKIGIVGYVV